MNSAPHNIQAMCCIEGKGAEAGGVPKYLHVRICINKASEQILQT